MFYIVLVLINQNYNTFVKYKCINHYCFILITIYNYGDEGKSTILMFKFIISFPDGGKFYIVLQIVLIMHS